MAIRDYGLDPIYRALGAAAADYGYQGKTGLTSGIMGGINRGMTAITDRMAEREKSREMKDREEARAKALSEHWNRMADMQNQQLAMQQGQFDKIFNIQKAEAERKYSLQKSILDAMLEERRKLAEDLQKTRPKTYVEAPVDEPLSKDAIDLFAEQDPISLYSDPYLFQSYLMRQYGLSPTYNAPTVGASPSDIDRHIAGAY